MNPVEQKAHTKRTDQLAGELDALETLHLETARRVLEQERLHVQHKKDFDAHSGALMALRIRLERTEQVALHGVTDGAEVIEAFLHREFWGRLRWLLTGK